MRPNILPWLIFASGFAVAEEGVTATGKVTDAAGKPLEHATVFIYEGRVRTGYGVYCPTCWADCGKHSSTDADSHFSIAGLNPGLRFKLMVDDICEAGRRDDPAGEPARHGADRDGKKVVLRVEPRPVRQ